MEPFENTPQQRKQLSGKLAQIVVALENADSIKIRRGGYMKVQYIAVYKTNGKSHSITLPVYLIGWAIELAGNKE